jgi:hypothetical protein
MSKKVFHFGVDAMYASKEKRKRFLSRHLSETRFGTHETKKIEYSDVERNAGKIIAAKTDQIYDDNDKRLEGKWFITQFLCYIVLPFQRAPFGLRESPGVER